MIIELGPGGKILGTKKVSANGQISGLSEHAGKEVLIILPGRAAGEVPGPNLFADLMKAPLGKRRIEPGSAPAEDLDEK